MKCDRCSNAATVHLTDVVNGRPKEIHLCRACAGGQLVQQEQNPANIWQGSNGSAVDNSERSTCPLCGIKYVEFDAEGRLGCPHDYEVFRPTLRLLLRRIHHKTRHTGKAPRHRPAVDVDAMQASLETIRRSLRAVVEREEVLEELRRQLRQAIAVENYELAARLRDRIRKIVGEG